MRHNSRYRLLHATALSHALYVERLVCLILRQIALSSALLRDSYDTFELISQLGGLGPFGYNYVILHAQVELANRFCQETWFLFGGLDVPKCSKYESVHQISVLA